ncbi:MAG: phosphoglycerate mutase (2,3-diphosphoglycerate-independent) [Rhodospirillaceae bacterium]|nr:phosphoglycerate mutase (2,3-diphosphoglycerate-independent) [Rhodospirillaceae bacterium]
MAINSRIRPVVLCVLDGWGERDECDNNAIALATTPVWDRFNSTAPRSQLNASERYVGLPEGQMGNSEVGHMNLGAGRIVMQDLPRIDAAITDGSLASDKTLAGLVDNVTSKNGTIHIAGLLGPGGVHSHQDHMVSLVKILKDAQVQMVLHLFLDGRDTPPKSARVFLEDLISDLPDVSIGTICGRYFAMDRDKRWDRVEKAYSLLVDGVGEKAAEPLAAIEKSYDQGVTDEFLLPTAIGDYAGMEDGDALLLTNFRADRAREILTALVDDTFDGFSRTKTVTWSDAVGMVEYSDALNRFMRTIFPAKKLTNVMGDVIAAAGLKQLRIAETEKYAHVTFFFNGGEERNFDGEDRILVESPKVATYDLQPEMSAAEVTDKLVAAIESEKYDFILVNYANTDMVGHTGILEAAITAVEAVDYCLGRLETAIKSVGGGLLITADHGNAEIMLDPDIGGPHTAHTCNLVPFVLIGDGLASVILEDGKLADVSPTVLALMGLDMPAEMTGRPLLRLTESTDTHAATG